jgi:hypothetical protein
MPVILATWEVDIRIMVPSQLVKTFARPHPNRKSWAWWYVPVIIPETMQMQIGGPQFWPAWAKRKTLSKITRAKRLCVWLKQHSS